MIGTQLRIALVAPPFVRVPPHRYGGTERVVAALADGLVRRGHDVTLFASGDSVGGTRLVPTVPVATWSVPHPSANREALDATIETVARALASRPVDVIHAHLERDSFRLQRRLSRDGITTPMAVTLHLPVDRPYVRRELATELARVADQVSLVAISRAQASLGAEVPWAAIVPNGLRLSAIPFGDRPGRDLAFVGRLDPEKGILDAIEIARLTGRRLRVAAKVGDLPEQRRYYEEIVRPAFATGDVDDLGELGDDDRNALLASSAATLMPVRWPEPFGLVAIESLAAGTPVIARPAGALPEIVRDGSDGALRDDVAAMAATLDMVETLDRSAIREAALARFDADSMTAGYEAVYRRLIKPRPVPSRDRRPFNRRAMAPGGRSVVPGAVRAAGR